MFSLSLFSFFTLYGNIFLDNAIYLPYYVIVTKRKEVYAMNFLSKLDALMADKELNKRQLANESGIPYTTIVNWYKRGYDNMSLSNFKILCDFFNVTMDSLARDDVEELEKRVPKRNGIHISKEEEFLVTCYREADSLDKELALRALHVREKGDTEKMA
ncbi:XRE family transcriptional regulator [Dorea formicigenerans]|uniref:XRE family transcriptional regulator n=2 Tax=Dorea formicigenerans TaxID=39486 RepID=A0A415MTA4_9FIRM|nr:XRE family transcriptional regulator [Dorea formicigenerans]